MKTIFRNKLLLLLTVLTIFSVLNVSATPTEGIPVVSVPEVQNSISAQSGFEKKLENNGYALYLQSETYNVAVLDKASGVYSYTFPVNADADALAEGVNLELLKSQLIVYYYDSNKSMASVNTYTDCVKNNNVTYSVNGDALSLVYTIGDQSFQAASLPRVLTKKRMEKDILSKLDDNEQEKILKYYTLYSKENMNDEAYKSVKFSFPSIAENDLYIRSSIPDYIAEGVYEIFEKAGYTHEDLQRDCDENQVENEYVEKPFFVITVDYKLTDDGFSASFVPEKIEYSESYQPIRINLLPFFGAADTSANGYMLVPDGCGSVINFNNGKSATADYWKKLFNDDGAIPVYERVSNTELSVLPIYALSADDYGFLATIDSGYEIAGIGCGISGKNTSYNNIYSFFDISSADMVTLSSNNMDSFLMISKLFSNEVSVSYHLTAGNTSYSEFALMYRSILQNKNILPDKVSADNTLLNINFVGSASVTKRFLGIPYETVTALTTYSQALEILEDIGDISTQVNFLNSLKGGYMQKSADSVKLLSILGSQKERKSLKERTGLLTVSFYGQRAAKIKKSDAVKSMNRSNACLYNYNTVSRYRETDDIYMILSPNKLTSYAARLVSSLKKSDLQAVNLLDLGYELNSDFNTKQQTDRYQARLSVQKYLEAVSKESIVSVDVGSVFAFSYIDKIRNIPDTDSGYAIEDYSVPFYQIVISGLIPYTAHSMNTADDAQTQFLSAVEYGAQLSVTWIYEKADNTVRSREDYYNMNYSDTLEQIKKYAESYSELYKKIAGVGIKSHIVYSENVRKTVWQNGICVYVNYGDTAITVDGVDLPAQNYCYTQEGI
ncbi:MAG: DUF5696 domain-containing protein [Acutalibacteraceae bacterium]